MSKQEQTTFYKLFLFNNKRNPDKHFGSCHYHLKCVAVQVINRARVEGDRREEERFT